ncbi:CDP-glucose 4,6-dehydratase [Roseobacter sp. SK209-2-6]|uniref:CDP-glucose 4,6-dehydratase n=1 Tax=Roseobacter sp. SK209-2-6 TaxID=388739 RepID=UPI0002FB1895|nr:CDP-glucose 4,6-dehydratase [Roseobacter sp. SK209-2-6]
MSKSTFRSDPSFWHGRRVFVTGHTGFKGSWLTAWLLQMQAQVRGFALPPTLEGVPEGRQSFFDELGLAAEIDHVPGDIRDQAALHQAVQAFDPEIVIHMAAQPLVRYSYAAPVETYATNVMGTVHLLEACRTAAPSLRSIVVVSSDKCYENREQIWGYRESDPMGGHDPYSNSKGCTELVTASYRSSYFPPERQQEHGVTLASGRAGNVIGGGDWSPDRIVPDAMRAFAMGGTLHLRNPGALRPWQHVLDPLAGYLRLAEMGFSAPELCARGWNFGPDDQMTLSVEEIVTGFAQTLGPAFRWDSQAGDGLHEAHLLKLDCTAARQLLGWQPQLDAAEMTRWTADWYEGQTPEQRCAVTAEQITAYRARLAER